MAASVFRFAILAQKYHFVPRALAYRSSLITGSLASKGGASITSDGFLRPVVDPQNFVQVGNGKSPEGESFVFLMEAAYKDWWAAGQKGANAAPRKAGSPLGAAALVAGVCWAATAMLWF